MGRSTNRKGDVSGAQVVVKRAPRSLAVAESGIHNSEDLKRCMSDIMSDLVGERIQPRTANAVCNAAGKLLRTLEIEFRYGVPNQKGGRRILQLTA